MPEYFLGRTPSRPTTARKSSQWPSDWVLDQQRGATSGVSDMTSPPHATDKPLGDVFALRNKFLEAWGLYLQAPGRTRPGRRSLGLC